MVGMRMVISCSQLFQPQGLSIVSWDDEPFVQWLLKHDWNAPWASQYLLIPGLLRYGKKLLEWMVRYVEYERLAALHLATLIAKTQQHIFGYKMAIRRPHDAHDKNTFLKGNNTYSPALHLLLSLRERKVRYDARQVWHPHRSALEEFQVRIFCSQTCHWSSWNVYQ